MPSEALQNLMDLLSANPVTAATPLDVQRNGIELLGSMTGPVEGVSEQPVDVDGVPAIWLTPDDSIDGRTILYLHGGGYNIGSLASHRGAAARLAVAARARLLLVDYRLAPEHPFPAALDDARKAYRWLLDVDGAEPTTLVVAGESAGGGLSLATLLAVRDEAVLPLPSCAALISPWLDLTLSGVSNTSEAENDAMLTAEALEMWASSYGRDELDHPHVSPLFGDPARLPPLLVIAAEREMLRDDSVRFAEKAAAAGVDVTHEVVPDVVHAWTLLAGLVPEADDGLTRVAAFIDQHA